jgi:hypothetical protein
MVVQAQVPLSQWKVMRADAIDRNKSLSIIHNRLHCFRLMIAVQATHESFGNVCAFESSRESALMNATDSFTVNLHSSLLR